MCYERERSRINRLERQDEMRVHEQYASLNLWSGFSFFSSRSLFQDFWDLFKFWEHVNTCGISIINTSGWPSGRSLQRSWGRRSWPCSSRCHAVLWTSYYPGERPWRLSGDSLSSSRRSITGRFMRWSRRPSRYTFSIGRFSWVQAPGWQAKPGFYIHGWIR
jgi:hypothetical protein